MAVTTRVQVVSTGMVTPYRNRMENAKLQMHCSANRKSRPSQLNHHVRSAEKGIFQIDDAVSACRRSMFAEEPSKHVGFSLLVTHVF